MPDGRGRPSLLELAEAALVRAHGVDEYVIVERAASRAIRAWGVRPIERRVDELAAHVTVFRDTPRGRGQSELVIAPHQVAELPRAVTAAAGRADVAVGAPWRLPPPAAPARVALADPLIAADLDAAAHELATALRTATRGAPRVLRARVEVVAERAAVLTSTGLRAAFDGTRLAVEAHLAGGDHAGVVRAVARRRADVDLPAAVAETVSRLRAQASARRLAPGRYDLVLRGAAALGDARPGRYGLFAPFVAQADATLVRRGLARYRPGQPVGPQRAGARAPGAAGALTIRSDGAVPYAVLSRPFGALGEPVREFGLVDRGVASGLALDAREAGLRNTLPNGGVRTLVVEGGNDAAGELERPDGRVPVVIAPRLRWIDTDPATGAFTAELGMCYRRDTVDSEPVPVIGGLVHGDAFAALCLATRSRETARYGWYHGPQAIRLAGVDVW